MVKLLNLIFAGHICNSTEKQQTRRAQIHCQGRECRLARCSHQSDVEFQLKKPEPTKLIW